MPHPVNMDLSVFRIDKLPESKIWKIGEDEIIKRSAQFRNIHGRADIVALNVFKAGLQIFPDNIPPRHANIINWPNEKSKRMEIAHELAAVSSLKIQS